MISIFLKPFYDKAIDLVLMRIKNLTLYRPAKSSLQLILTD